MLISRGWTANFWLTGLLTTVILFCWIQESQSIPQYFVGKLYKGQTRRDYIFDRMLNLDSQQMAIDADDDETKCKDKPEKILTIGWFNQTLDHFNGGSNTTYWQQHYQINDKYFDNKTSTPIIFLMIGGEGPINSKWVCYENYTYMQAAKNYSAKVIQLEHRFFGSNKGLKDLSTENLKYLTTEQAMADIKTFIEAYNKEHKWTSPKWVAFGGSYPGTIAALLRVVYPNITQGNIASSAPLYAEVDFWQYADVMERTIANTTKECYDAVKTAFTELNANIYSPAGRQILNDKFIAMEPKLDKDKATQNDLETVTSSIFSAFQGIIQYTYDGANEKLLNKTGERQNIAYACKLMTEPNVDSMERLYNVFLLANGNDTNFTSSYQESITDLQNIDLKGPAADMRGWMWLSCNQFGWLQSTTNNGLFGDAVPISLYIKTCSDLFNQTLNATQIYDQIGSTLQRYGHPKNFSATNVFLPNGGFDPWSAIGVKDDSSNTDRAKNHLVTRLTPQAAHCSDMYPYYDNEPVGLNETRRLFYQELNYYISLDSVYSGSTNCGPILFLPFIVLYFYLF